MTHGLVNLLNPTDLLVGTFIETHAVQPNTVQTLKC